MAEFRKVTEGFSVAPQIDLEDLPRAAAQGFKLVINNRPDGEAPGQPTSA
ncbi:MAG TPA: sulfur transferase domain-containing protein, partial [Caulobacteraceae bacterium]|nr:sulfur transferase domain-containing protein [Caulobacteraceae bacterium]